MSYLGFLFNSLREGSTTAGQYMASVPETLYDIAARITDPIASYFTGEEVVNTSAKFKEDFGIKIWKKSDGTLFGMPSSRQYIQNIRSY